MKRDILNIVNKVLSEEINGKAKNIKKRLIESDKMCSECGSGSMVEGECSECGYMEGDMAESKKLSKGQEYIAKQAEPKDKIGANDFKKLRAKKTETKEGKKFPDLSGDGKVTKKDVLLGRGVKLNKESVTYKLVLDESTNETFYFNEDQVINIIENIVLEEKKNKKSTKTPNVTKDSQSKSKKQNDDYINSVVKKMKDYLKDGSKGEYEMDAKHFPKGNGELAKMSKMAYVPSDTAQEYIDNFTAAGLENLDYDEIHPNEEWVEKNLVGSSVTGNNPEWGNAVETEVGERRNKIRKNNLLAKVKRDAYQKDDQPVKIDSSGENFGDNVESLLKKYSGKKVKKESTIENNNVLNEMNQIKKLMGYKQKTQ